MPDDARGGANFRGRLVFEKAAGRKLSHRSDERPHDPRRAFEMPGISATIARDAHAARPRDETRGGHASKNRSRLPLHLADPDSKREF